MRNSRLSGAQVIAALADVLATHHAGLEPEAPPEAPPEPAFDEEVKLGMTGTQQSVQDYILGLNDVDLISQIRAGEESRVFTTKKARVYVLAALDARLEAIHDAA